MKGKTRSTGRATLAEMPRGRLCRILGVPRAGALRLAAFGIYPGVVVKVEQQRPSTLLLCQQTEVALEGELAGRILVDPLCQTKGEKG